MASLPVQHAGPVDKAASSFSSLCALAQATGILHLDSSESLASDALSIYLGSAATPRGAQDLPLALCS